MLHTAVLLDLSVSAVVVGKQQAFCRNEFSRTSSCEEYDGIFERRLVYAVDVIGIKSEAL